MLKLGEGDALRVLVVGARGMLGREIMELAPEELGPAAVSVTGADIGEVDIANRASVDRLIEERAPAVIINAAAYTNVDGCESDREAAFAVNADGAGHLARAASGCGARFLHISTDFVFDGARDEPYDEEDAPNPINVYGESKLAGERQVAEAGGDWAILRTAWLYGRHGKNFVDTMRRLARERPLLSVVTDQIGSPTWARDLAEVVWEAVPRDINGIFHAVNHGACSRFDLVREIVRLEGLATEVRTATSDAFPLPARRPPCVILSTEKLTAALGRDLRGWRAALAAYLKSD